METEDERREALFPIPQGGGMRGANRPQLPVGELGTGNNLDKVRDLLFGSQMRDVERRFTRLEERLLKEQADLKEETRGRFESLEQFLKQEMETLAERLRTEQDTRTETVREVSKTLQETTQAFEQRAIQLEEHMAKTQRDLRQHILDQSRSLRDESWEKYRELSDTFNRGMQELRAEKTDRATLAVLLTELAMRLGNDYLVSGSE